MIMMRKKIAFFKNKKLNKKKQKSNKNKRKMEYIFNGINK